MKTNKAKQNIALLAIIKDAYAGNLVAIKKLISIVKEAKKKNTTGRNVKLIFQKKKRTEDP
jgi:hypothetical protein